MSRIFFTQFAVALSLAFMPLTTSADECTPPSSGPDAVVMDVVGSNYWVTIGNTSAFSFGSDVLNKGDAPLPWNGQVGISQNAYRLKDNRFEQIGMSWVKVTGFASVDSTYCGCSPPGSSFDLGQGCSDVYSASFNGTQSFLRPRSTVNGFDGSIGGPAGGTSNDLERRLQVAVSDIDPALNAGAIFFAEIQIVSPSDAFAGNSHNNNSSEGRNVVFSTNAQTWIFQSVGSTNAQQPAIFQWAASDAAVTIEPVDVPGEGRFYVASRVGKVSAATWRYEYAIFNMNSHRSARSFSLPVPPGVIVTNIGFHDVAYHSGEPYDASDWAGIHADDRLTWSTQSFDVNENANALRWGTLYNFRFDANGPPGVSDAIIELFRPGVPSNLTITVSAPVILVPTISSFGLIICAALTTIAGSILIASHRQSPSAH